MSSSCSKNILFIILTIVLSAGAIFGQTSGFTYQGRLTDGGTPANGNYDLQFALFEAVDGNNQIGQTQAISNVGVSGGVFTVTLDFGANAFSGANRFLEISARPGGAAAFTLLTPRQPITATPYALRSLNSANADAATNAQQLAGVAASQYVKTDDARLSDARDPKAGNSNYVQNSSSQQAATNFNVSGNGTAGGTLSGNIVNAATQYNLGGQKVLGMSSPTLLKLGDNANVGVGPSLIGGYKLEVNAPDKNGLRLATMTPGGRVLSIGGSGEIEIDSAQVAGGRLRIQEGGNVGIGTVPGSKLTVAGIVESQTGGFKFPNGSVQTNAVGKTFTGATNTEFEILHNDNFGTIISTPVVPPGVYLLTATVAFENKADDGGLFPKNTRVVRCFLGNDLSIIGLGAPGSAMEFATLTVHTVFTQPVESVLTVTCGSRDGVGKVFAKVRRVTAIRVAD
jgi:hypothetical protein